MEQTVTLKILKGLFLLKRHMDNANSVCYNVINHVISLSFELEPECYGEENASPGNLPQIPMEGILNEFYVYVTDSYNEQNQVSEKIHYDNRITSIL